MSFLIAFLMALFEKHIYFTCQNQKIFQTSVCMGNSDVKLKSVEITHLYLTRETNIQSSGFFACTILGSI